MNESGAALLQPSCPLVCPPIWSLLCSNTQSHQRHSRLAMLALPLPVSVCLNVKRALLCDNAIEEITDTASLLIRKHQELSATHSLLKLGDGYVPNAPDCPADLPVFMQRWLLLLQDSPDTRPVPYNLLCWFTRKLGLIICRGHLPDVCPY